MNELSKDILSRLSPEEHALTLKILNEMSSNGNSDTLNALYKEDYDEIPVDIDTFISDEKYLGKSTKGGTRIWPYWRQAQREIFEPDKDGQMKFQQVILTGSIGIGKSQNAVIGLAYVLYKLLCLKDPQEYYELVSGSEIVIAFFNATLDLSSGVGFTSLQNILQESPWFMERGKIIGTKNKEYVPNKNIRFKVGSQASHGIGQHIFAGMLDEVNFVKGSNVHVEQSKIMDIYSGVLERMKSRFMRKGRLPGVLFLVSSKKSEHDFLETYVQKQKHREDVYIVDKPLWDVKPSRTYSGKWFDLAVGNVYQPSKIVNVGEDLDALKTQGYEIIQVPIEHYEEFVLDIDKALMNIAGISISHYTRFISYESISGCYCPDKNPFTSAILVIGFKDTMSIKDFYKPKLVSEEIYTKPIFIHIDTSLTGDITGIGAVAVMGYKYVNHYDINEGTVVPTKEILYKHLFSVGIKAPAGSEISFQKTREFIYYLKYVLEYNIIATSLDGYQSADSKQQLIVAGFQDSTIVSLDRKPDGYLVLKSAMNEKRIAMLDIPELELEAVNLERDNITGKVDHKIDGSKDLMDGLAGAIYNASLHEAKLNLYQSEFAESFIEYNDDSEVYDVRENLLHNLTISPRRQEVDLVLDDDKSEDEDKTLKEILQEHIKDIKSESLLENTKSLTPDEIERIKFKNSKNMFNALKIDSSTLEDLFDDPDDLIMM